MLLSEYENHPVKLEIFIMRPLCFLSAKTGVARTNFFPLIIDRQRAEKKISTPESDRG